MLAVLADQILLEMLSKLLCRAFGLPWRYSDQSRSPRSGVLHIGCELRDIC